MDNTFQSSHSTLKLPQAKTTQDHTDRSRCDLRGTGTRDRDRHHSSTLQDAPAISYLGYGFRVPVKRLFKGRLTPAHATVQPFGCLTPLVHAD